MKATSLVSPAALLLLLPVLLGAAPAAVAQTPAGGGPREAIQVHGHWVIDVRNPDGSLATHSEFENGLTIGAFAGDALLADLLSAGRSAGKWQVTIGSGSASTNDNPCGIPATTPPNTIECNVGEPTLLVSGATAGTIELSGSFTVINQNAIVGRVQTGKYTCNSDVPPSVCRQSGPVTAFLRFTAHTLETPIPVVKDQLVQFKVVISFS